MLNIEKLLNVLSLYCVKVDNNTFRLNVSEDILSDALKNSIISYIDNGYLIKNLLLTKSYSYALMRKRKRSLLLASVFGKVLDVDINITPGYNNVFNIFYTWCNSSLFMSCFDKLTHFSFSYFIPNSSFRIQCRRRGEIIYIDFNFISLSKIEISIEK